MNANRGRPVDEKKQAEQKKKLLHAAHELLDEKSFRSVTIREIAQRAGVNSAMVRYYFSNKEGLFIALFTQLSEFQASQLRTLFEDENPIKTFIYHMLQMATKNRGLIRFVHDEVLHQDSSLKHAFVEGLPKNIAQLLPQLIQSQMDKGNFRNDLDPKAAAFSLMSMIMLPVVIDPVREDIWNIPMSQIKRPEWANHIYQLFLSGCCQRNG